MLGYVQNQSQRFTVYVSNRVARIRKVSSPQQWNHVETGKNPADQATRSVPAHRLKTSKWLTGPVEPTESDSSEPNPEIDTTNCSDIEIVSCVMDVTQKTVLGSHRFERFSSWQKLVATIGRLQHFVCSQHPCTGILDSEAMTKSERFIIGQVQREHYGEEIYHLKSNLPLSRTSTILTLDPFLDEHGLLRVGGRLNKLKASVEQRNPLILPGRHHVALLIVRYYHEQVKHQGRHLTEGAVRSGGFWITGGKRLVSSLIHKCVKCRKLLGRQSQQKMLDLPEDRLTQSPPFTYVGVDTFGPWSVVTRKTRGGSANSKRWALRFTCLVSRAIHIEVIEEMSSSSFINAVKRFISIRGPVREFRSDRGTNFVVATDSLNIEAINVEDERVKGFLCENRTSWIYPPHSSHMGRAWERFIGVSRGFLNQYLMTQKCA